MKRIELETPHGGARAHVHRGKRSRAALVLGHGAGGGVSAPDLVAATEAALAKDVTVALVEQPYRVAGRRSPAPAHQLDTAWTTVVSQLRDGELEGLPLITGGRSAGARVACRTAEATNPIAVLCLAFPLQPARGSNPQSRLPELEALSVPVLVVQGTSDPFGMPPASATRTVAQVPGNHSLRKDIDAVRSAVGEWLGTVLSATTVAT